MRRGREVRDGDSPMRSDDERIVRHAGAGDAMSASKALRCAACGLRYAIMTQRNFRVHFAFSIMAIALGAALGISAPSWLAVVLCIAAVLAMETVNTAIESVVDMVSPEWSEQAKRAKDCSAGAVLVVAIASLAVAAIVYLPRLADLVFG